MDLGSNTDKTQESLETETRDMTFNLDQATVTYLSYQMSLENTNQTIKFFKDLRLKPRNEWPEDINPELVNENLQLANYTKEKLTYLIDEIKQLIIELDLTGDSIIKSPNW